MKPTLLPDAPRAPKPRPAKVKGGNAVSASRVATEAEDLDFYPTPPWAARAGGELIAKFDPGSWSCWEPACGEGHMAFGLHDYFATIAASDIHPYGYGDVLDFLAPGVGPKVTSRPDWVVTNPPFKDGEAFIRRGWDHARRGVAMLLRLQFREGEGREALFHRDCPLTAKATFVERAAMHKGRWEPDGGTTTAYAWFLFLKPDTVLTSPLRAAIEASRAVDMALDTDIPAGTKARLSKPGDRHAFGLPETGQLLLGATL